MTRLELLVSEARSRQPRALGPNPAILHSRLLDFVGRMLETLTRAGDAMDRRRQVNAVHLVHIL